MKLPRDRWAVGQIAVRSVVAAVLIFLALPLVVVIVTAFNNSAYMQFPPRQWSLRWFHEYFDSGRWIAATKMSVELGSVVAAAATLLGLSAAAMLDRLSFRGRQALRSLIMAPLIVPVIVLAAGLYYMLARLGFGGTFAGLTLGHLVVAFPYASVVIGASLEQVDRRLEDAAVGLGANRLRAFIEVTLPLIRPSVIVAALFSFLISFDEVVISIFLAGPQTMTLPRVMWESIRFEISPTIAAVSTILIIISTSIMLIAEISAGSLRSQARCGGSGKPVTAQFASSVQGATIELAGILKRYAGSPVVDNVSLRIEAGEFVSLLGPSGSGKTTTLMMVAGFVPPDEGRILLGGADITQVPPHRRDIGMVYQSYALFPHMTVTKNVAFPLRMRRLARAKIEVRVRKALELVHMEAFGHRLPGQLSGGQQQRVALARALVFEPPLLLMDEPLGALDKKLREEMQCEIKRIQQEIGSTAIYVTHDQEEALNMSDRIVVMDHGRIEQIGTPSDIHDRPRTRFVADFMGVANLIETTVVASAVGCRVRTKGGCEFEVAGDKQIQPGERLTVALRAERVVMRPGKSALVGEHAGRVLSSSYRGSQQRHQVELVGGERITVLALNARGGSAQPGEAVLLRWHPEDAWIIRM